MKKIMASMLILFMGITVIAQELPLATTKGAVRLFGDKDDLTSVITIIPDGSTVEVVTPDSVFTRVFFDGADGFVKSDRLEAVKRVLNAEPARASNQPAASEQPVAWPQQQAQQAQPQQQAGEQEYYAPEDRYEMLVNKYGIDIGKRLYQHKVWKGVNSDMARDSWGKPIQINRMYVDQSIDEEWIYSKKYLYFRDGILIEWGPVK
ncbi:MAG: hypothetical protein LC630_04580 [Bacteroidales bacterium]|nr:hypothetical protein [Bacteroidales bacterium]